MLAVLEKLDRLSGLALKYVCIGCMVLLIVVLSGVVLVRFFPVANLSWSDEVVEWAFAWMVFIGAAALWREKAHFCVDAFSCKLGQKFSGTCLALLVELVSLLFLLALAYYGYILASNAHNRSPILEWPRPIWYACIPIAGTLMSLYSIRNIILLTVSLVKMRSCGFDRKSDQVNASNNA